MGRKRFAVSEARRSGREASIEMPSGLPLYPQHMRAVHSETATKRRRRRMSLRSV